MQNICYLSNVHGFSPFQYLEKKSNLPNILNNKLPALEEILPSKIISNNFKAMEDAQKASVHSESSKKIKRALRCNTRTCNNITVLWR